VHILEPLFLLRGFQHRRHVRLDIIQYPLDLWLHAGADGEQLLLPPLEDFQNVGVLLFAQAQPLLQSRSHPLWHSLRLVNGLLNAIVDELQHPPAPHNQTGTKRCQ
jgi:hypothetical protein